MGLVKAALGAASGVMGDQWKEYFYCSALPAEVLAVKGQKKVSGRSSNRHGTENIITDGSIVAVAEGQCALIVEQLLRLCRRSFLCIEHRFFIAVFVIHNATYSSFANTVLYIS